MVGLNKHDKAEEYYKKSLEVNQNNFYALSNYGALLLERGNIKINFRRFK